MIGWADVCCTYSHPHSVGTILTRLPPCHLLGQRYAGKLPCVANGEFAAAQRGLQLRCEVEQCAPLRHPSARLVQPCSGGVGTPALATSASTARASSMTSKFWRSTFSAMLAEIIVTRSRATASLTTIAKSLRPYLWAAANRRHPLTTT